MKYKLIFIFSAILIITGCGKKYKITPENFKEIGDYKGVREEFMQLNGFDFDNVDYDQDLDLDELAAKKI